MPHKRLPPVLKSRRAAFWNMFPFRAHRRSLGYHRGVPTRLADALARTTPDVLTAKILPHPSDGLQGSFSVNAASPATLTRTVVPSAVATYPWRMRTGSANPRHASPFTKNFLSIYKDTIQLFTEVYQQRPAPRHLYIPHSPSPWRQAIQDTPRKSAEALPWE